MGPLPPLSDPARSRDKLPQPYRMIDKLVSEIVEKALSACVQKDELKKKEKASNIGMRFAPHATLAADGGASCFTTPGIAGLVVVGTAKGEVIALTARDPTAVGKDTAHETNVTAMDSGNVAATGAKLVASASQGRLVVHDVMIKTAELLMLAKVDLPDDPDDPEHVPCKVTFSTNASHLAVCYTSGAVAVYELELPPSYYTAARPDNAAPAAPAAGAGRLQLVLHMTVAAVKGLLIGSPVIGTSNIEWRQQQRPDKSGKSDRFHKPARGIYIWWKGCNRIALCYLREHTMQNAEQANIFPAAKAPLDAAAAAAGAAGAKPTTPKIPSKPATPVTQKTGRSVVSTNPSAVPEAGEAGEQALVVNQAPAKSWMLPHGITCSCICSDGTMLAFGLTDGTVIVWDDHFGSHIRILPRMPTAISAMAYVNGLPNRLFCTSACGTVYVADFTRPEDSYTAKGKLPHTATQVHFMASDPFAICMCPGSTEPGSQVPRLVWFDMSQQKFVAECVGKSPDINFGMATTDQWPPPPPSEASTSAPVVPYPRWNIKESYFIAGGPLQRSTTYRPPNGVLPEEVPDDEWPREAVLLLYKIDALARYLMPEENQSKASKSLLERMLADLHAPKNRFGKHVKYDQPDPDAPKPPPSALRRGASPHEASEDEEGQGAGRRHIMFDEDLFDDESKHEKKHFKKETRSGGYSEGNKKPEDPAQAAADLAAMNRPAISSFASERPASPPWHHTNPLARIHPDWEEAPVLARIMDRIGSKGGGRKKRDRRLIMVAAEMGTKLGKEAGPKPVLLTK